MAVLLLLAAFAAYAVWGKGTLPQTIRQGVRSSLEEDFRIKESLGELFFAQKKQDSVATNAQTAIVSLLTPAQGEMRATEESTGAVFACKRFSAVLATADGVIESVDDTRLTLRHADGKLSVYQNVGTLWQAGKNVKRGDTVGYATGEVIFRLYVGGVPLDPRPYFVS